MMSGHTNDNQSNDSDVLLPKLYRLLAYKKETPDIFTLNLVPVNPKDTISFQPGQFNMIYGFGAGEVAISISGKGQSTGEIIHTIRRVGSVTTILSNLEVGQIIGLRGPFGQPWPVAEAVGQDIVVVAGGIGLAPLRPLLRHFFTNRKQFKKISLLYGLRTPADLLYADELVKWQKQGKFQVEITVDAIPEFWPKPWKGSIGVVTPLIDKVRFTRPTETVAYLCGPEVMMRFVSRELNKKGVLDDKIFLSMERHMKCAVGFCGRCQYREHFVCKDGPVFKYNQMKELLLLKEL
jgi:NAD(P)H-flavin reductase